MLGIVLSEVVEIRLVHNGCLLAGANFIYYYFVFRNISVLIKIIFFKMLCMRTGVLCNLIS